MTTCKDVYSFLSQVSARSVSAPLPDADTAVLTQLGLIQILTGEQYRDLTAQMQTLASAQADLAREEAQRAQLARTVQRDLQRTHSVLFHFHGKAEQTSEVQRLGQEQASLGSLNTDVAQREKAFNELLEHRALLDTLVPYGDRYVGITGLGAKGERDLAVRLYRASDTDFSTYWAQSLKITQELQGLADHGAEYFARLAPVLGVPDRSYLWAIGIGLTKVEPMPAQGAPRFVDAYAATSSLSSNPENRLMSAEVLFSLPPPAAGHIPALSELVRAARKLGVPEPSALGVASILLAGQRGDGSFATGNLPPFLAVTRSYESAALLAIMNQPADALVAKFQSLRAMFAGWGYLPSEDLELSSAYLAVSELPLEGMSTKLAIIARGLQTYLQYPLVAASILSAVSTLEANETLNLLEQAYDIVGRRAMPMSQSELICLAVRMVHGIRNELVGTLDSTATVAPAAPAPPGLYYGPRLFFVPIIVAHNAYFSTFSGVSGPHPGHVHGFGGGAGGFSG